MKKILLISLLATSLFFIGVPVYGGLVPCGLSTDDPDQPGDQTVPCQFCHLFVMVEGIIDFLLFRIVPVLAVLMIAIGGFMYIFAPLSSPETLAGGQKGGPKMLSQAKRLLTAVVIGLLIIYGAFIFIGFFLWFIGLADWTTDIYHNWWEKGFFEIPCKVEPSLPSPILPGAPAPGAPAPGAPAPGVPVVSPNCESCGAGAINPCSRWECQGIAGCIYADSGNCVVPNDCEKCGAGALNLMCDETECLIIGECQFIDRQWPIPNECHSK